MHTFRFVCGLLRGLCRSIAVGFTVAGLSACGVTGASTQPIPTSTPNATPTPYSTALTSTPNAIATPHFAPTAVAPTASSPGTPDAWKTYQNNRAGYTIDYPAAWNIDTRTDLDGSDVTTFASTSDNTGTRVAVIVRNSEPADQEIPDIPNTRCQQVTNGELSGRRCFDTLAFSLTTTFVARGKIYILVGSGRHLDRNIYQRFLSSWTIQS